MPGPLILFMGLVKENTLLSEKVLFSLHKAVQTEQVVDVYKPVGAWKREPNSTVMVVNDRQMVFEYSAPGDTPFLMGKWFKLFQAIDGDVVPNDSKQALAAYVRLHASFVRIHPFFDGNGRLARLIANIPVIKSGLPPIIIPREERKTYIDTLSAYHCLAGTLKSDDDLLPNPDGLKAFSAFCKIAWKSSLALVAEIRQKQAARKK